MAPTSTFKVRPSAVAGLFYPNDRAILARDLSRMLDAVTPAAQAPKALVVPHAGYVYSGPVAASAYARLAPLRASVRRVVLLGPSHRVALNGMAVSGADAFETPLGRVTLDGEAIAAVRDAPGVVVSDAPHAQDHALEVQLPFLQTVLADFRLVPIAVGPCDPARVADVLDTLWGGPETLIVVSTDLSHFHSYDQAQAIDSNTVRLILEGEPVLSGEQACGCHALNGLLVAARRRGVDLELLDLRNSGDTAGDRSRVVGYASFALSHA